MSQAIDYDISAMEPAEINFCLSSWKKSFREANPNVRTDAYYLAQGVVCDEILQRFPTLLAARNPDGVCLGWICAEATPDAALVVHYTYVKSPYRRLGIAKNLLSAALDAHPEAGEAFIYTHKTRMSFIAERLGFSYVPVGTFLRNVRTQGKQ